MALSPSARQGSGLVAAELVASVVVALEAVETSELEGYRLLGFEAGRRLREYCMAES